MANATLTIHDSKEFTNDIWQDSDDWNLDKWKTAMEGFSDTIYEAKIFIEAINDYIDEKGIYEEVTREIGMEFLDDKLYVLGDITNFFNSIDIN